MSANVFSAYLFSSGISYPASMVSFFELTLAISNNLGEELDAPS